jgi:hypothetical protein
MEAPMSEMIEVVIDSIRVSLMSQQRIVILREQNNERYLAIWIGVYEAEAITMALQEVQVSRPLTWDLLRSALSAVNARVLRVEVVALREDTFFGNIVIEVNGQKINIDSRPSDAIALAVRVNAPIFVSRTVMEAAGVVPEEDLQQQPLAPKNAPASPASSEKPVESKEDRLSIFEDFLENLNKDSDDKSKPDEDEKD